MAILSILLTTIIIIASILIVLVVLVQRPKQEGLGASFGSSTFDSTLGAGATDFLQKLTTYLGVIFFVSAIGLAVVKSRQFTENPAVGTVDQVKDIQDMLRQAAPPTTTPQISTGDEGIELAPPAGADAQPAPVTPSVEQPEVTAPTPVVPETPAPTVPETPASQTPAEGNGE